MTPNPLREALLGELERAKRVNREMRSLLPAFREMGVGTTKLEAALLDSEQRCTCRHWLRPRPGPAPAPMRDTDPNCPVHPKAEAGLSEGVTPPTEDRQVRCLEETGDPLAESTETGELGGAIKVPKGKRVGGFVPEHYGEPGDQPKGPDNG